MRMTSKSPMIAGSGRAAEALLPLVTPGQILQEEFLEPLGLSMNALARALGVPANRLQAIVKNQRGITADTALRLALYFGTTPEFWMNLQSDYELDRARRERLSDIVARVARRVVAQEQKRVERQTRKSAAVNYEQVKY
jgi:antitoxin HigA-1